MKPKVVIDTSTLLSACIYPDRAPAQAVRWLAQNTILFSSKSTFHEAQRVLLRPNFERWRKLAEREIFIAGYRASLSFIEPTENVTDCRDPTDNQFLSLALAAKAEFILASDPDLLVLNPYQGISILTVKEMLAKVMH